MNPESDRTYYDDDTPDPALVWRWIGKATRPVIGWILLGLAAIFILVGWIGVSGTPIVAKQIPYVVSGGIAGVLLAIAGAYFLATEELRKDSGRLDRLERMVQDLHQTLLAMSDAPKRQDPADGSERSQHSNGAGYVALAGSDTYHRPDCAMVAAKQSSSVLAPSVIRRRQMTPCSLCEPALADA